MSLLFVACANWVLCGQIQSIHMEKLLANLPLTAQYDDERGLLRSLSAGSESFELIPLFSWHRFSQRSDFYSWYCDRASSSYSIVSRSAICLIAYTVSHTSLSSFLFPQFVNLSISLWLIPWLGSLGADDCFAGRKVDFPGPGCRLCFGLWSYYHPILSGFEGFENRA